MNLDIFKLTRTIILVGLIFCVIVLINRFELQAQNTRVVNSINVEISSFAEPLSDVEYWQYDPKGNLIKYDLFQNSGNGHITRNFQLGKSSDERDGCVVVEQGRRKGTCEDGLYRFDLKSTDAPGNASEISTTYIERDTVKPFEPTISNPYICGLNICIKAKGEPGSKFMVNGLDSGILSQSEQEFVILWNWKYSVKYEFEIWAMDIAGNESMKTKRNLVTPRLALGSGTQDIHSGINGDSLVDPNTIIGELTTFQQLGKARQFKVKWLNIPKPQIINVSTTLHGQINIWGINLYPNQIAGKIRIESLPENDQHLANMELAAKSACLSKQTVINTLISLFGNNHAFNQCFNTFINKEIYTEVDLQVNESNYGAVKVDSIIITSNCILKHICNEISPLFLENKYIERGKWQYDSNVTALKLGTEMFPIGLYKFKFTYKSKTTLLESLNYLQSESSKNIITAINTNNKVKIYDYFWSRTISPVSDQSCTGYSISSVYGWRVFDASYHDGVDIAKIGGCVISAINAGKVIYAGWENLSGFTVKIDHENDVITYHYHLEDIYVSEGQRVNAGDQIGYMGSTGNSTGTHLHFTIKVNGVTINPTTFFIF